VATSKSHPHTFFVLTVSVSDFTVYRVLTVQIFSILRVYRSGPGDGSKPTL